MTGTSLPDSESLSVVQTVATLFELATGKVNRLSAPENIGVGVPVFKP
jgi:hypothetical protein